MCWMYSGGGGTESTKKENGDSGWEKGRGVPVVGEEEGGRRRGRKEGNGTVKGGRETRNDSWSGESLKKEEK